MSNEQSKSLREKIAVWGVGDWGIRVLEMINPDLRRRVRVVAMNSDLQSLICSSAHHKLQIGKKLTGGRGTGGDKEMGAAGFQESRAAVQKALIGTEAAVIIAGLGGGLGSGTMPLLCGLCREMGVFALALITRPFEFEGKRKAALFREGWEQIKRTGSGTVCFYLDHLLGRIDENTPCEEAFRSCDLLSQEAVECLLTYLTTPSPAGGDHGVLKSMFSSGGECVLGRQEESDPQKLVGVMKGALSNLFLTAQELSAARGCLVQIRSGKAVPIGLIRPAISAVAEMLGDKVSLVYNVQAEPSLGEKVKATILVSGLPAKDKTGPAAAFPVVMTTEFHPPKQTEMDFRKTTRGRFSEMEPTIMDGEDLDIPTFIRKGEKL